MPASSKETPCLRRFCLAFSESHSNVSFTASLYPSEMTQRLTAQFSGPPGPHHQMIDARSARAGPLQRHVRPALKRRLRWLSGSLRARFTGARACEARFYA